MRRSEHRKAEISAVIKRGGTIRMLAFLLRALMDPDLTEAERARYERTYRHLTSKYVKLEEGGPVGTEDDKDPFA